MSRSDSPELASVAAALDAHGCNPRADGQGYRSTCPAHGGDNPEALSVADGRSGVVVTCHTHGCTGPEVAEALGLAPSALFFDAERRSTNREGGSGLGGSTPRARIGPPQAARPPQGKSAAPRRLVEAYVYEDEDGQPLYRAERYAKPGGKTFRQARYDAERRRYVPGMKTPQGESVRRVLYRLPAVLEAVASGRVVFVVEGEKDVHTVEGLGFTATTCAEGAGKWRDGYAEALRGAARVVVLPDNDEAGERHARDVARSLLARGIPCAVLTLPGLPEKGDVTDWATDGGGNAEALWRLAGAAPLVEDGSPWLQGDTDRDVPERDDLERDAPDGESLAWRPLPLACLPRALRRYAEAYAHATGVDPAAVAVPMLAVLSAAVGNTAAARVGDTWAEPSPLWAAVVAPSGSGKSPALDAALAPVYDLEREAQHAYKVERERYDAEAAAAKEARGRLTPAQRAARSALPQPAEAAPPKPVRYRVGDVTAESVLLVHADNPRGLLLARDELAGWIGGHDRYAKGGRGTDMQVYIEMYGGRPVTVDRKSNAERPMLYIERPAVAVTGTIQPQILARVLRTEAFESGFAPRLLLAAPPMRSLTLSRTRRGAVRDVEAAYHRVVRRLYARPLRFDDFGKVCPGEVEMTGGAYDVFAAFHAENARRTDALPEASPLRSVLAKVPGVAVRLALALHLAAEAEQGQADAAEADGSISPMSTGAVRSGCTLALWFAREAARLYARHGFDEHARTPDEATAERLPTTRAFTVEDVRAAARLDGAKSAYKVLRRLLALGVVRCVSRGLYERIGDSPDESASLLTGLDAALDEGEAFDAEALGSLPGSDHAPEGSGVVRARPTGDDADAVEAVPERHAVERPPASPAAGSAPPVLRAPAPASGPFAGVQQGDTCHAFGHDARVIASEPGRLILCRADEKKWPETGRTTCTATAADVEAGRVVLARPPKPLRLVTPGPSDAYDGLAERLPF